MFDAACSTCHAMKHSEYGIEEPHEAHELVPGFITVVRDCDSCLSTVEFHEMDAETGNYFLPNGDACTVCGDCLDTLTTSELISNLIDGPWEL